MRHCSLLGSRLHHLELRRVATRYPPALTADEGFAYRAPKRRPATAGVFGARTLRTLPAIAALTMVILPQQAGNSASLAAALPGIKGAAQASKGFADYEAVPVIEDAQIAIEFAAPFVASYGDAASPLRAEDCLTQAIYYEGALEPEAGQRAIAQVVLNRVRHPQYPNSVCGVVFEGQHLATGCQFTFTCDGSRRRAPIAGIWRKANLIAKAALGGAVTKEVGLATHYHADYVQPYWASSLDPAGQIGRHIFYRWRGGAGRPAAFSSAYAGREPLIGEWVPRTAEKTEAASQVVTLASAGGADGNFQGMSDQGSQTFVPAPFKARPLQLATREDQLQ
jgi:hypothetical protein